MRILVECTFTLPVEVPDDPDYPLYFDIEENHCPGTGAVGLALEEVMAEHMANSTCWACELGGKNKIVNAALEERAKRKW